MKPIVVWQGGKIVKIMPAGTPPTNFYEAAEPSHDRKRRFDRSSGDAMMARAGDNLRIQARHLDDNHDLAKGILDTLVNRTVGRGIRYEPQVLDTSGNLHDEFNQILLALHEKWSDAPTVRGEEYTRADMERLLALTWFRDGEVFKTYHQGKVAGLQHYHPKIPLSINLFEPDYCPHLYHDTNKNIRQGVERDTWGRATYYYFYKAHPGDYGLHTNAFGQEYSKVSAAYVNHIKTVRRIGQVRGVSIFAAIMHRLDDLKDYEEAERIAARIAAKLVGYVRKGSPDMYGQLDGSDTRTRQHFENGMTLFDMLPGEEVGIFDTKRPNTGLNDFRAGQLRAAAAGAGISYSSAAKDYNGTFSAQRQELVEQQENYEVLQEYFINHACKPDYRRFVAMAILGGAIQLPDNIDLETLFNLNCYGAAMPWIDPEKEAAANQLLLDNGLSSHSEIIRRRGGNPINVFRQRQRDQQVMAEFGITPNPPTANPDYK